MPGYIRVFDPTSKTQYSIPENGSTDGLEVLDAVAVDHLGDPLPPAEGKSKAAAQNLAQKENS